MTSRRVESGHEATLATLSPSWEELTQQCPVAPNGVGEQPTNKESRNTRSAQVAITAGAAGYITHAVLLSYTLEAIKESGWDQSYQISVVLSVIASLASASLIVSGINVLKADEGQ